MKNTFFLMMFITSLLHSQKHDKDHFFFSAGLDTAIASGLDWLSDGERVGSGNLNYMLQFGIESFSQGEIRPKFGVQYEGFKAINYVSGGLFGGITFSAPTIPKTGLTLGHYWYTTVELNLINRKGLKGSRYYNSDGIVNWALGLNLGVKIQKVFKTSFDLDLIFNIKNREDIKAHFGESKINKIIKPSFYILITCPL